MADLQPVFDQDTSGKITSNGTEKWVDLGLIPNGKQMLLGFATFCAEDKNYQFEIRCNRPTKSAGTIADTDMLDISGAAAGGSVDRDLYYGGLINTLAPQDQVSTGVEHWWLRVTSQGSSSGTFDYIIRYAVQ